MPHKPRIWTKLWQLIAPAMRPKLRARLIRPFTSKLGKKVIVITTRLLWFNKILLHRTKRLQSRQMLLAAVSWRMQVKTLLRRLREIRALMLLPVIIRAMLPRMWLLTTQSCPLVKTFPRIFHRMLLTTFLKTYQSMRPQIKLWLL